MNGSSFSIAGPCAALSLALSASFFPVQAASNLNSSKSNLYRSIANDADRTACVQAGGSVVVRNGTEFCQLTQTGHGGPEPQQGVTITGCTPSASGDPLKGLNVSKGGTSSGGQLCP